MLSIGDKFMSAGIEYRIDKIIEDKKRIILTPDELTDINIHEVNTLIKVENDMYKIIYIHKSKKRITVEKLIRREGI